MYIYIYIYICIYIHRHILPRPAQRAAGRSRRMARFRILLPASCLLSIII